MTSKDVSYPEVSGCISPLGIRYLHVKLGEAQGYVPHAMAAVDERASKAFLADQHVYVGPAWRHIHAHVPTVTNYDPAPIADRFGWNANIFASLSGEVITPAGDKAEHRVIGADPSKARRAGSMKGWLSRYADNITGQSLPMTLTMASLASPLLEPLRRKENSGLILYGADGAGKSYLLDNIASVSGANRADSANTTIEGLESEMAACNGSPLFMDELSLYLTSDSSSSQNSTALRNLGFRLGRGTVKKRWMSSGGERYWFTPMMTANVSPIEIMRNEKQEVRMATLFRLLPLYIAPDRPFSTFDFLPKKFEDAGAFAEALERAAERHHGHALPMFVQGLVNDLAQDRSGTLKRIKFNVKKWCERAGIPRSDGRLYRVGETFGLFYAAGEEAKRHGVLPSSWACGTAVLAVYRNFYVGPKPDVPIDDAVRAAMAKGRIRNLDKKGVKQMSDQKFHATFGFTKRKADGSVELCISPAQQAEYLPDLAARIGSSKAGLRLIPGDRGHNTVKRQVRTGKPDRLVVLRLPADFK